MSHTTLTLLGLCCLSAALLGGQASAARTPAALQGASERADGRAQGQSYWSCSSYAAKALVTALDVQRTADGGLAATVKFAPGKARRQWLHWQQLDAAVQLIYHHAGSTFV